MKDERKRYLSAAMRELDKAPIVQVERYPCTIQVGATSSRLVTVTNGLLQQAIVVGNGQFVAHTGSSVATYSIPFLEWKQSFQVDAPVRIDCVAQVGPHLIATLDCMNLLTTWNINSGEKIDSVRVCKRVCPHLISIANRLFVIGDLQGNLYFVEHSEGRNLRRSCFYRKAHEAQIFRLEVHGNLFVVSSSDLTVSVWNSIQRRCIRRFPIPAKAGHPSVIDIDQHHLILVEEDELRIYKNDNDQAFHLLNIIRGTHSSDDLCFPLIRLLTKEYVMVTGGGGAFINLLNLQSGIVVARIKLPYERLLWLDITADGRLLASALNENNGDHGLFVIQRPPVFAEAIKSFSNAKFGKQLRAPPKRRAPFGGVAIIVSSVVLGLSFIWRRMKG